MTKKVIKVVVDFNPTPYGRYQEPDRGIEWSGERFRDEYLAPALKQYDYVHVDLTGYNRYGISFLDEAFGGLIRESKLDSDTVLQKLTYSHDKIKSIAILIKERIDAAINDK